MASVSYRNMWIRTIIANVVGIAILLIGWGTDSGAVIALGFVVLIISLGVRIAAQLGSRRP
jgi:hypothetical protein